VLGATDRPVEALATAREALRLGLEHGDRHRAAALHTNLADRLHAAGAREEALEHLTAAARLFGDVDDPGLRRPEIWKLAQW
jgi:tetratricopeptide (TPR) repeat protein